MLIYRVENSKGRGPFWNVWEFVDKSVHEELCIYMKELFGDCRNHPHPSAEMVNHGNMGCRSLEELALWFDHTKLVNLLTANGFNISIYNVKTVLRGCKQISFAKRNAKLVDTLPLSHIQGLT